VSSSLATAKPGSWIWKPSRWPCARRCTRAGAAALTHLLHFASPPPEHRRLASPCGHQARYRDLRTKPILTALGCTALTCPYSLCPHCHTGQFPADVELDNDNTDFSPGVRRMNALVGQAAPFEHGRQQMQ